MQLPVSLHKWRNSIEVFVVEGFAGVITLLLFSVFLAVLGSAPLDVLSDLVSGAFGSTFSVQNTLSRAAPLMLTALCTAVPGRAGLLIIGNEGALLLGGLGAVIAAQTFKAAPAEVLLLLMVIAGMASGGGFIWLAGLLRRQRGVNETISSLLLYYIALAVFLWLVEGPMRDPASLNKPSTLPIGEDNMLANIPGTDIHLGLVFGIVACLLCAVLTHATTFGFGATVAGGNARTARMMGLPVDRYVYVLCIVGGAAAGLAGVVEVTAIHGSANASLNAGLGFAGILVAFVARYNPLAVIPVAILIGGIEAAGGLIQRRHDLPDATVDVLKGILFVAILACETLFGRFAWLKEVPLVASKTPEQAATAETSATAI
jgi:general nucleoside transport system permease protein